MNLEQKAYYEETASKYDDMHIGYDEHAIALAHMNALAKAYGIKSILDVGSGTGRAIEYFLKEGYEVKGIEPVKALIDIGIQKGRYSQDIVQLGNGEKLPFPDKTFDGVCEYGILHHVKNPELIISEMMRVARQGIFISDCNRYGHGSYIKRRIKYLLKVIGLWEVADILKTHGKGFIYSAGDGISYSYSVYDSIKQIAQEYPRIIITPTDLVINSRGNILYPLFESHHILLSAFKENLLDKHPK